MRPVPVLAALVAIAFAAAARHAAPGAVHGSLPAWALFSFAVSAFREPLR